MTSLAAGLDYVDLRFLGRPGIIATAILQGPSGVALVDPGPSSTLATLTSELAAKGIALKDVRQIILTHIHLDHAGVTGSLVHQNPEIEVYVHERGAPHMIDPSRLLASATRLYGADMDRLWGEFAAVPADRVNVLRGGERFESAGRELLVEYTPGHASHHVSYFDPSSRVAFVGDTAGIREPAETTSCRRRRHRTSTSRPGARARTGFSSWDPDTLFLTHFGPFHGSRLHFQQLFDRLGEWSRTVRRLLADRYN